MEYAARKRKDACDNFQEGDGAEWRPLPDRPEWRPLAEDWRALEEIAGERSKSPVKVLSEACRRRLQALWLPQESRLHRSGQDARGAKHCDAGHFHCYPIANANKNPAFACWRQNADCHDHVIWWCASLKHAAEHYSWTSSKEGRFEFLAAALQSAMRRQDEDLTALCCSKILAWGGLNGPRKNEKDSAWLTRSVGQKSLIAQIRDAAARLCPQSTRALDCFGNQDGQYPMTSGTTKIYAAAALDLSAGVNSARQDVLILDGRVGAALGYLAAMLSAPNDVPDEFRFPWGYGTSKSPRNPSTPHSRFPPMSSLSGERRAKFTRLGAQCIQDFFGIYQPSEEFVIAEKALFMIGYDVRNSCGTSGA